MAKKKYHNSHGEGSMYGKGSKDSMYRNGGEMMSGMGDFANMPQEKVFKPYPKPYDYMMGDYADTIDGIDRVNKESVRTVKRHPTMQK